MKKWNASRLLGWGTMAAGLAVLGGCTDSNSPLGVTPPLFLVTDIATVDVCASATAEVGKFKLIKLGGSGTFEVSVDGEFIGTVTLDASECARVLVNNLANPDDEIIVTVTEISAMPTLIEKQVVALRVVDGILQPVSGPVESIEGSNTVSGPAWGQKGTAVVFHNDDTPPPPPPSPPPGGEGCTPGFWKQKHHFGWWTSPYTPATLFSDVFEDAFSGKTLLQVLKQGGGGLKALGRHTVAALLNAASPDVAYDATAAEVIAAFNDVYPGSKSDLEDLKDIFEEGNEQGCPLGRNADDDGGTTF